MIDHADFEELNAHCMHLYIDQLVLNEVLKKLNLYAKQHPLHLKNVSQCRSKQRNVFFTGIEI